MKFVSNLLVYSCVAAACLAATVEVRKPAAVSSMESKDLADFDKYPKPVQQMIEKALALTKRNLTYRFASADPANGGMDCSGTMYYLLHSVDIDAVPRQSDEICQWLIDEKLFHRTENVTSLDAAVFDNLRPGDLLFWSGTYAHTERQLPVSHVMLYLGKRVSDGKPVAFGASDGRSYEGKRRCGVSLFDFKLPKAADKAEFYGYGPVPGLMKQGATEDKKKK
ncbi:MAG: C40 family peptidase [Verrucomicrobiales bacterium]|nr:C40 family peptidase [Verrucomicrobiales bacterium]MCP5559281.1 C40 family peptidase [Verrucomicrobiaceae bacterium]